MKKIGRILFVISSWTIAQTLGVYMPRQDVSFSHISHDTRTLKKDDLFIPRPHGSWTEAQLVQQAIAQGAKGIVTNEKQQAPCPTILFPVKDISASTPLLYRLFYPEEPRWIVAVTGTDGKTSVSFFLHQLWTLMNRPNASVGTLGLKTNMNMDLSIDLMGLTTPIQPLLSNTLDRCKKRGIDHVVFEASSQALDQRRIDPVHPNIGIFTSFGQDHLDYHGCMANYYQAKWSLFSEKVLPSGYALLHNALPNVLEHAASLKHLKVIYYGCKSRSIPGANNATFNIINAQPEYQDVCFLINGHSFSSRIHLVGTFQIENILAALIAFHRTGGDLAKIAPHLHRLYGVPGRLQLLSCGKKRVYIDYAHTPDALKKALSTLRPHIKGRLVVLFGCGGNRDASKRLKMGQIAEQNADHTIITDDNPRYENPQSIRDAILEGCPTGQSVPCRKKAIFYAIQCLGEEDALLVAGKGHELTQSIKGQQVPFSDVAIVRQALDLSRS